MGDKSPQSARKQKAQKQAQVEANNLNKSKIQQTAARQAAQAGAIGKKKK